MVKAVSVTFSISGDGRLPENSMIVIPLTDPFIDRSNIKTQASAIGSLVKEMRVEENEIRLIMNRALGGDNIVIPLNISYYSDGRVPYDWVTTLNAYVVSSDGGKIVAATLSPPAGTIAPHSAKITNFFNKGSMRVFVNSYSGVQGNAHTTRPVYTWENEPESADVYFGYYHGNATSGARLRESITVTYNIPTYTKEGGGAAVYAVFDQAKNPNWTVAAYGTDGVTPIRVVSKPFTAMYVVGVANSAYRGQLLVLGFPNAQRNQMVTFSASSLLTPMNMSAHEKTIRDGAQNANNIFYFTDSWTFHIPATKTPPTGTVIRVDKNANPIATQSNGQRWPDGRGEFFDYNTERIFNWDLTLNIGQWYTAKAGSAILHDVGLDPRMFYHGVSWSNLHRTEITAFDNAGNILCQVIPSGSTFLFSSVLSDANVKKIHQVDVRFLDEFISNTTIQILTRLRDTTKRFFDYNSPDRLSFNGYAWGEFEFIRKPGIIPPEGPNGPGYEYETGIYVPAEHGVAPNAAPGGNNTGAKNSDGTTYWTHWRMMETIDSMRVTKTANPWTNSQVFRGDTITYTVGISGEKSPNTKWEGLALIDLLPACVDLVQVRPAAAFLALPGAKYEVINNYNNTGRTAVLFTVSGTFTTTTVTSGARPSFSFNFATIETRVGFLHSATTFTNNAYAKVNAAQSTGTVVRIESPTGFSLIDGINPPFANPSQASVAHNYNAASELSLRKYIRNTSGENQSWSSTGILTKPGEEFEYRIALHNSTNADITNGVIYDVFPYTGGGGDVHIDLTQSGEKIPRGSEFANTLVSVSAPLGWTVYYTSEPPENSREFYNRDIWSSAPADVGSVTAIKIAANPGTIIPRNSNVDFVIKMKAPNDPALEGKRAHNTAARIYGDLVQELECNAVYNEIRQRGAVSLQKVDENGAPLSGARFQLYQMIPNASNPSVFTRSIIATVESDVNGRVEFTNLIIDNYKLEEVLAPDGYKLNSKVYDISREDMINSMYFGGVIDLGTIENEPLPPEPPKPDLASIKLVKNSVDGTPLAGVQFKVTALLLTQEDRLTQAEIARVKNGVIAGTTPQGLLLLANLPLGEYKIEEIYTFALGRLEANWNTMFTLSEGDVEVDLGKVLNNTASVTLTKIELFSEVFIGYPNSELNETMGPKLSGIEFKLFDGMTDVTAAHASSAVTDTAGRVTFTGLALNKTYTLKEIFTEEMKALYQGRGSGAESDTYEFMITEKGALVLDGANYDKSTLVIGNNRNSADYYAKLIKTDKDGMPFKGVEFTLYTNAPGFSGVEVTLYTDDDGIILLTKADLEGFFGAGAPSKYFIKEVKAPLGYSRPASDVWEIDWNHPDGMQEIKVVNMKNELNLRKYSVTATTVDEALARLGLAGADFATAEAFAKTKNCILRADPVSKQWTLLEPLAGAEFTVEKVTGAIGPDDSFTAVTSGVDGKLPVPDTFIIDEDETYQITEIKAPAGFVLDPVPYAFKVADLKMRPGFSGEIYIERINGLIIGSITISKFDRRSGNMLGNVGFTLFEAGTDREIITVYTGASGLAVFSGLPLGDYYVVETMPLPGYKADSTKYSFSLTSQHQHQSRTMINDEDLEVYDFSFTKIDEEIDEGKVTPLAGAVFRLYSDAACDYPVTGPVTSADVTGIVEFTGLIEGTYYLKETSAPAGYDLNPTVYTVQVGSNCTITDPAGSDTVINNILIKNMRTVYYVDVYVKKLWVNDGIPAGFTPPSEVTVKLTGDGSPVGSALTLNAGNGWGGGWEGLFKYNSEGVEITYTVEEDEAPQFYVSEIKYSRPDDSTIEAEITNSYAQASIQLNAKKVTEGRALGDNKFSFELYETDAIDGLRIGGPVATVENSAGNISFVVDFSTRIDGDTVFPAEYYFEICEKEAAGENWGIDSTVYRAAVTINDDFTYSVKYFKGDGITPVNNDAVIFTNKYTEPLPPPPYSATGSVTLKAEKIVIANDYAGAPIEFDFAVTDKTSLKLVATGKRTGSGEITFTPITYFYNDDRDDRGVHTYILTELWSGANWEKMVSNNTVTVNVSDNGDGTLNAAATYPAGGVKFTNTFDGGGGGGGGNGRGGGGGPNPPPVNPDLKVLDPEKPKVPLGEDDSRVIDLNTPLADMRVPQTDASGNPPYGLLLLSLLILGICIIQRKRA